MALVAIVLSACSWISLAIGHFFRINSSLPSNKDIMWLLAIGYDAGAFIPWIVFKGIASFCFVLLAVLSVIRLKKKSERFEKLSVFILIGLSLAFVADILLEIHFVIAFVMFVIAQFFYFLAFLNYGKVNKKFFIASALMIAFFLTMDVATPFFNFGDLFVPSVVYMISLVIVVVKSFESFKWNSIEAKLMPIGTLLFGVSDFFLQFWVFSASWMAVSLTNAIFIFSNFMYYSGQLLVAYSLSKDYIEK